MSYELQATTEPGRELVALAESFAPTFLARVAKHDREGTFPFESLRELEESGYLYAPIPPEFGGMGVQSVHDVLVAASRLARGDAGLTLGVNMHMIMMMTYAQQYRAALATGDDTRAAGVGRAMARAVTDRMVI
ncbi:MAG: acyl-CoA dehydrogenase family protein, partial [Dehalococcoidia bacterium]|nr:acyl-CoA dehydrogenase family protein [Dehalococcoidia bacterium]